MVAGLPSISVMEAMDALTISTASFQQRIIAYPFLEVNSISLSPAWLAPYSP
jgi:hypothetical protein